MLAYPLKSTQADSCVVGKKWGNFPVSCSCDYLNNPGLFEMCVLYFKDELIQDIVSYQPQSIF